MTVERRASFLHLPASRLESIHDRVLLRDPRGRSSRPSLTPDADGTLHASGRFLIVQEYKISKDAAIRFLEVTRDENPIHVQGDIAPGAMTLSKTLLPLEVLFDGFSIAHVKAKFTGASFYGQRTVNHYFLQPGKDPDAMSVRVNTYQAGRIIAKVEVKGSFPTIEKEASAGSLEAPKENLESLRAFCESLSVSPSHYLEGDRLGRADFPRAFLASLPSGEMVRQLKGKGGMLNVLSLDFLSPSLPLTAMRLPEVQVEKDRKGPKMFNRVLTRILDGLRTYGQGFALVYHEAGAH